MLLALAAAGGVAAAPVPKPAGLANPASVACGKAGGATRIVKDAMGGAIGICVRKDGTQCEEWALFRDKVCVLPPGLEGR